MIVPVNDIGNHIRAMSVFPQAQMKNLMPTGMPSTFLRWFILLCYNNNKNQLFIC